MKQIICIGNRFVPEDAAGPAVYDRLKAMSLPEDISIVDGGLAGLNLLPLLEMGGRVVFVDAVSGLTTGDVVYSRSKSGRLVVLDHQQILQESGMAEQSASLSSDSSRRYGHSAGLPYLLAILPHVCEGELPSAIKLIGLEGGCSAELIDMAARLSLAVVRQEGGTPT